MHHGRNHLLLLVTSHHDTEEKDDQSWHRIERHIARLILLRSVAPCRAQNVPVEPVTHALGFDQHATLKDVSTADRDVTWSLHYVPGQLRRT